MKRYAYRLTLIGLLITHCAQTEMRLILTSALTDSFFEVRKEQYLEAFRILRSLGYNDFYIIEGFRNAGPSFLDEHSKNVFYSTAQDLTLASRLNGINEAKTCLQGVNYFDFDPDDMIVKLTGRYHLVNDSFFKTVQNNINNYDAIVKINPGNGNIYTLCFAMKCKYYKEMYETLDYHAMQYQQIDLETQVGNYVKRKIAEGNFKILYVDKLDVKAILYGTSTWTPFNVPSEIGKAVFF